MTCHNRIQAGAEVPIRMKIVDCDGAPQPFLAGDEFRARFTSESGAHFDRTVVPDALPSDSGLVSYESVGTDFTETGEWKVQVWVRRGGKLIPGAPGSLFVDPNTGDGTPPSFD